MSTEIVEGGEKKTITNIKILAENVIGEELVALDASISIRVKLKCFDIHDRIKALIQRMLSSEDIMKIVGLRLCDNAYVAENLVANGNVFEGNIQVLKNTMPNKHIVMGPRPCEKPQDTSVNLHIRVQFN